MSVLREGDLTHQPIMMRPKVETANKSTAGEQQLQGCMIMSCFISYSKSHR